LVLLNNSVGSNKSNGEFSLAWCLRCAKKREHVWVTRRKRDEIYQQQSYLFGRSAYSRYADVGVSGG
jgi:hypothetical protein